MPFVSCFHFLNSYEIAEVHVHRLNINLPPVRMHCSHATHIHLHYISVLQQLKVLGRVSPGVSKDCVVNGLMDKYDFSNLIVGLMLDGLVWYRVRQAMENVYIIYLIAGYFSWHWLLSRVNETYRHFMKDAQPFCHDVMNNRPKFVIIKVVMRSCLQLFKEN